MKESTDRYYNLFSPRYWIGQIDLRPLGFMRIVFGAVVFWSTIDLAPVLFDFFSDFGVAPRAALLGTLVRSNRVSLFDIAGPPWLLVVMYLLTLIAILMFTIGWHTKLASVATFLLVCGIHERNLLVFDGSDNVLRVLLFWLMFMPAGARYSIDAVLRAARGAQPLTHGTALPIRLGQIQIAWVYLNTIIHKWPGVEWHNGTALRIALGLDHLFTRSLGRVMFNQHWFVWAGTHLTIVAEATMLPLVFLPLMRPTEGFASRWPKWIFQPTWKALGLIQVTGMHVGIALLMSVGNFSYIMIASFFLFYEPEWIAFLMHGLRRLWAALSGTGALKVLYDGECAVCTQLANTLRGFDAFGNLDLVNFRDRGALSGLPAGLSKTALDQRLHVIDSNGVVRSGWAAVTRIARRVPALAPLGLLGTAPGIRHLGNPLYEKVAAHRKALLGTRAEAQTRLQAWGALIPQGLVNLLRNLMYTALVVLMAGCLWFALPDVAKIPPVIVPLPGGHKIQLSTTTYDVSPSRMWPPLHDTIQEIELWQKWDMFSPKPLDHDVFLQGRGQLTDGTEVDVVRGDRGDGSGPVLPPINPGFFFTRWTKYINNIVYEGDNSPWTLEFGRYLCRRWNANPPRGRPQLKTFKLFREEHKVPLEGEPPEEWKEQMIWDHHCF